MQSMQPALLRKPCLTLDFLLAYAASIVSHALSVLNIAKSLVKMKPTSLQLEIAHWGAGLPTCQ